MDKRILLIGATGTLGSPVLHRLTADGFEVRALTRNPQKAHDQFDTTAEIVAGDVFDPDSLGNALEGCAGVHVSVMSDREDAAVANVVAAAKRKAVERITYVSGATVCEQNRWFAQTDRKCRAEQTIRASGIRSTIFCPTWFMEMLPRFAQGSRAVIFGAQPNPLHWLAVDDFARMVSKAYVDDQANDKRFTIWGPEGIPMREALQCYCAALRPDVKGIMTMPIWAARMLALVTRNDTLRFAATLMAYFRRVPEAGDPEEANRILGAPQTTLDQWLRQRRIERTAFAG